MAKTKPFALSRFQRVAEEYHIRADLEAKLKSGRPLRIKYGVDVTAPFLHIGHAVNLWMMRDMQDHGHKVVFLIGDFTTMVGDPTDKNQTRGKIPPSEIAANADRFIGQVTTILNPDPSVFEVRRNSEWWSTMSLNEFMNLLTMVTHSRLIERDMFKKRIANGREIFMHEMLYPILQGYDSFALESDLTIVGTDQLFNELMGRFFQERLGQSPQVVITTKITPGTDGKEKQSKSLGNYIAISDPARDKFGKVMSLPDQLVRQYMEVYTDIPQTKINEMMSSVAASNLNPRDAKRALAQALVERYHGRDVAEKGDEWFMRTFSQRQHPTDARKVVVERGTSLVAVLEQCLPDKSKSELRRLIRNGAVRLDQEKLIDPEAKLLEAGTKILRAGRRGFFELDVK